MTMSIVYKPSTNECKHKRYTKILIVFPVSCPLLLYDGIPHARVALVVLLRQSYLYKFATRAGTE